MLCIEAMITFEIKKYPRTLPRLGFFIFQGEKKQKEYCTDTNFRVETQCLYIPVSKNPQNR